MPINSTTRGVMFALLSAISFAVMGAMVKILRLDVATPIILFLRFSVGTSMLLPWMLHERVTKQQPIIQTQRMWLHLFRGTSAFLSLSLFFIALKYISLVDAVLLISTFPFFIPLFALLVFSVKTSKYVMFGIFIGFIGVALVLKPGAGIFQPAALLAIGAAIFGSIGIFSVRQLSKTDSNLTILSMYFFFGTTISGLLSIPYWHGFPLRTWGLLCSVGLITSFYQFALTQALRDAPARVISPIYYFSIPCSLALDWLIWRKLPDTLSFIGIFLVCVSAMFVVYFSATNPTKPAEKST